MFPILWEVDGELKMSIQGMYTFSAKDEWLLFLVSKEYQFISSAPYNYHFLFPSLIKIPFPPQAFRWMGLKQLWMST